MEPAEGKVDLTELLKQAKERVDKMTPTERVAMFNAQRESWVRSIIEWPKAKYEWIRSVKVYASYEDYVND